MSTRVVHAEIPIDDASRAGDFYQSVFEWRVARRHPFDYWTLGDPPSGALTPREEAPEGVIVYISVADIDATLEKIMELGGTPVSGKTPVATVGYSAQFRDSEGNLLGLLQLDPSVQTPDEVSDAGQ